MSMCCDLWYTICTAGRLNDMAGDRRTRRIGLHTAEYVRLAAFRHALRRFLNFSEVAAAGVGLTGQHYQAMLAIRGNPSEQPVTINDLAQHLIIKHNSAVGLVDRLVQEGLVTRETSAQDRRKVQVLFTDRGEGVLGKLASMHRQELKRIGPAINHALEELFRSIAGMRKRRPRRRS